MQRRRRRRRLGWLANFSGTNRTRDHEPLCSFKASAIVSKPKWVVDGASCGDFGGGVYCCVCLTEHEKHLNSAAVRRLLPASNCRPTLDLEACILVLLGGSVIPTQSSRELLDARRHVQPTLRRQRLWFHQRPVVHAIV